MVLTTKRTIPALVAVFFFCLVGWIVTKQDRNFSSLGSTQLQPIYTGDEAYVPARIFHELVTKGVGCINAKKCLPSAVTDIPIEQAYVAQVSHIEGPASTDTDCQRNGWVVTLHKVHSGTKTPVMRWFFNQATYPGERTNRRLAILSERSGKCVLLFEIPSMPQIDPYKEELLNFLMAEAVHISEPGFARDAVPDLEFYTDVMESFWELLYPPVIDSRWRDSKEEGTSLFDVVFKPQSK